jgi:nucleoside-diphosphate kinase
MSTLPVRSAPRYGAAVIAATALTGFGLYQGQFSNKLTRTSQKLCGGIELNSLGTPLLLEGKKTMAGEKGTASERSFVMVSMGAKTVCGWDDSSTSRLSLMELAGS